MLRFTSYRRWLAISMTLAMVFILLLGNHVLIDHDSDQLVRAQGNQPAETVELFQPFWEAWDLLHENYVDPLDDDALVAGGLEGMLAAAGVAPDVVELPETAVDATTADERFRPFWETWNQLHEHDDALTDVEFDDTALMEGALRGMLAAIGDPHTDYMDPEMFTAINESMSGEYEGIGATVRKDESTGGLELVTIFEGSPAEEAGLHPGDQIIEVEEDNITHLSQSEIIALVRGPAGSEVQLGIMRSGEDDLLQFDVKRGRINVPSVGSEILEDDIGYVRLSQFEFNTSQQMRNALDEIDANHRDGLILDLRGNPGGYLTTSIEVASAYLNEGTVLIERSPDREINHEVLGNAIAADVPMIVLVDQGSASASELIAGALQDHTRATVVGMPTFGKGSVQTWRELSNGGGIRITISRWYTPDGTSVSEVGIQPDIVVPYDPEATVGDYDNQLAVAIDVLRDEYDAPDDNTAQTVEETATATAVVE